MHKNDANIGICISQSGIKGTAIQAVIAKTWLIDNMHT
jgi:hypothetical protein